MQHNENHKALFICNEKFLDPTFPEGGVKFCTDEYLALLKVKFEIVYFPVKYSNSFAYKFSKKIGISAYNDYNTHSYKGTLKKILKDHSIEYVFLNLTNTVVFAKHIKEIDEKIKVILCSHGNESGDYLHDIVKFKKFTGIKSLLSAHAIGNMLIKESTFRNYVDLVLTVSEIEIGIEKWLGAAKVYMVPRHIDNIEWPYKPILGRVGFFADLSHEPNYYGINEVCKSICNHNISNIIIHLAGGGSQRGQALENKYPFVKYLGYLSNEKLQEEITTWTFALNPVFYYSRGVSTKLGKSLSHGIPVITSDKGLRGYQWKEGEIPTCYDADGMAMMIQTLANDLMACEKNRLEMLKIQLSAPSYNEMMTEILSLL